MTPNLERRFWSPHANVLGRRLPTGSKAEMRRWIDLTNEAQHDGTRKVSLKRVEEKSSVDRPDLVCSFHNIIIHIRAKMVYVHNL